MAAAHTETHTETLLNHPRLLASTARNGWALVTAAQVAWAVGDIGWPSLIYGFGAACSALVVFLCHRQARAWRGVRVVFREQARLTPQRVAELRLKAQP